MAVDDIIISITANQSSGSDVDFQPGGGIEAMLLSAGVVDIEGSVPNGTPALRIDQIDGTNNEATMNNGNNGTTSRAWFVAKMMADNTNYIRFNLVGGSTSDMSYAAIVVG